MDFKQLEAYVKTIELNSFSKAAETIYVSQPSISVYISSLEKELETQLILRNAKGIKLTKTGKIFYEYAKNILTLRDKAVFSIKSQLKPHQGEIEIHASSVPAQYILPEVMVNFNKEYPDIFFKIIQSDTKEVIRNVLDQKCEFGIVGAKTENQKCNYEHIVSESLSLIGPAGQNYPTLTADNITDFFYHQKWLFREEGSATRYFHEDFMKKNRIKPEKLNIVAYFSNTQSIIHGVSKGLGLSIVSEIASKDYVNRKLISLIPSEIAMPARDFYFVFNNNVLLSPHSNLFVEYVCNYYTFG